MLRNSKNIIFFGVLILILVFGYLFVFRDAEDPALTTSNGFAVRESARVGQEMLQQLQRLRSIRLDESVFSEPLFRQLSDTTQEVRQEPIGRDNPFAPIQGTTGNTGE